MLQASAPKTLRNACAMMKNAMKRNYVDWLAGMLAMVLLRVLALLPMAVLFFDQRIGQMKFLALLTPVLYLFVILPLRYSMGEAAEYALKNGGSFSSVHLISFSGYGQKLKAVFMQGLHLLPWALPLFAGLGVGWYLLYGVEDGTQVLRLFINLGKVLGPEYGFMEGIYMIVAFAGLLLLILLFGMMRNGMLRFVWAQAGGNYTKARREMLRRLKGHRLGQFAVSLIQSLLLLPVIVPAGYMGWRVLRDYIKTMRFDLTKMAEPQMFFGALAVIILLYLPLLPLRKALQAQYIRQLGDEQ